MSFYSIVRRTGDRVAVVSKARWPLDVNVLYYSAFGGRALWGAPGGSLRDSQDDMRPGVPSIMSGSPSNYRFVSARLPLLNSMLLIDNHTVVAATGNSMVGDFNIHIVDTTTATARAVFPTYRRGFYDITPIGERLVAVAERDANRIVIIDVATASFVREIVVPAGSPRSLTKLGHCLVAASQDEHKVSFFDLNASDALVDTWDLTEQASAVRWFKKVSVDPESGTVFLRSAYPMGDQGTTNGVLMVRDRDGVAASKCTH